MALRKTCQDVAKNPTPASYLTNKQTAEEAFHDAINKMVSDSQFQNKVANQERQILEAKKTVLQKQIQIFTSTNTGAPAEKPASNPVRAKNSKFGLFYKDKFEKSHLVPLMHEHWLVDI